MSVGVLCICLATETLLQKGGKGSLLAQGITNSELSLSKQCKKDIKNSYQYSILYTFQNHLVFQQLFHLEYNLIQMCSPSRPFRDRGVPRGYQEGPVPLFQPGHLGASEQPQLWLSGISLGMG